MRRVLCIISSLDIGGAETFLMKIFRALPKEYKLDFVVSKNTGYYESEVYSLGGNIYRVPMRTKKPMSSFFELKRIVMDNNYDVVLKLCDTSIGYFDLLAAKQGGAKKICVRSCNAGSGASKLKMLVISALRSRFNSIITVKIAPSILAAEYTFGPIEVKQGNVHILHNAVDLNIYRFSKSERDRIRKEFCINEDTSVFGHIGRFNVQKNHFFLMEVFQEIVSRNNNSRLLLVGEGELLQDVKGIVKDLGLDKYVIFCGIRSDIAGLLSAMDCFIFPSFYEGLPNTIIEAQATGLSCVLADTITKEARITNLLTYMSLNENPKKWAKCALELAKTSRTDTTDAFINAGYNIEYSVKEFIRLIF